MMGVACRFDPRQHVVIRSCVADAIGRGAPAKVRGSLFFYRHRVTGNYVVGQWTDTGHRMFMDVLNVGPSLGMVGNTVHRLGKMFEYSPVPLWKELGRHGRSRLEAQQDEAMEHLDWEVWKEGRERLGNVHVALSG